MPNFDALQNQRSEKSNIRKIWKMLGVQQEAHLQMRIQKFEKARDRKNKHVQNDQSLRIVERSKIRKHANYTLIIKHVKK